MSANGGKTSFDQKETWPSVARSATGLDCGRTWTESVKPAERNHDRG